MRALALGSTLLLSLAAAPVAAEPSARYRGEAALVPAPAAQDANRRYALDAVLVAARPNTAPAGFALDARLLPAGKQTAGACGVQPDPLFADGFETP